MLARLLSLKLANTKDGLALPQLVARPLKAALSTEKQVRKIRWLRKSRFVRLRR